MLIDKRQVDFHNHLQISCAVLLSIDRPHAGAHAPTGQCDQYPSLMHGKMSGLCTRQPICLV